MSRVEWQLPLSGNPVGGSGSDSGEQWPWGGRRENRSESHLAELDDSVEQWVREKKASFVFRSVACGAGTVYGDGDGGGGAGTGTGPGWRGEFRFEHAAIDAPDGHLEECWAFGVRMPEGGQNKRDHAQTASTAALGEMGWCCKDNSFAYLRHPGSLKSFT